MQERLSGTVSGPSAIFPRGYLWLAPAWYAIATCGLALMPWPAGWFRLAAAAGLLLATATFMLVLGTLRVNAFWADHTGVRLGLPKTSSRPRGYRRVARGIGWPEIERVRLISTARGAVLEIMLGPDALSRTRPAATTALDRARSWLLLLIWPAWYARWPTGLTTALPSPARYRVPLCDCTVDDLRHVLRAFAPSSVTVAVLGRDQRSVAWGALATGRSLGGLRDRLAVVSTVARITNFRRLIERHWPDGT